MIELTGFRSVLAVQNLHRSVDFYCHQLGFALDFEVPGWAFLSRDKFSVMMGECADALSAQATGDHSYFAYVRVQNIDALAREFTEKHIPFIQDLADKSWGMREFGIRTPDGHRIMFGEPIAVSNQTIADHLATAVGVQPQNSRNTCIALLVIDMQNHLIEKVADREAVSKAIEHINYVASLFRQRSYPVVMVRDIEGYSDENRADYEIIQALNLEATDLTIEKVYSNAFWQTDLDATLQQRKVGLVIVAGFAAEHCVLFTYQGAKERGFRAAILQNGIVSYQPDTVAAAYRDREVISYSAVEHFLLS